MRSDTTLEACVELQPGIMTRPGSNGEVCLIGGRCEDCGTRVFPARERCVSCFGPAVLPSNLDRLGKVDAFTIVRQAPPGYCGPVPYVLAMVIIANEVTTLCHLQGKPIGDWRRGDIVASYSYALPTGGNQQSALTFAFYPATPEDLSAPNQKVQDNRSQPE